MNFDKKKYTKVGRLAEKKRAEYQGRTLSSAQGFLHDYVWTQNEEEGGINRSEDRIKTAMPFFLVRPTYHEELAVLAREWASAIHK